MEPPTASLEPEMLIHGRYLVRGTIGRGGMGAVYEAVDQRLGHAVALKQMLVAGPGAAAAFEREARILAGLRHPGLPRVTDYFSEARGQFLVMEFIPGSDLGALLGARGRAFPVEEVLRWAEQALDVLAFLHAQQPPIVHRDIKPQNLKLTPAGEIVLLDFGLAKGLGSTQSTATASLFGYTPNYAPLEQVQGAGTTPASDLYALAATLHHLLTGAPPPDVLQRGGARAAGQPDPLRPAHELNPLVPPALGQLILQGLQLDQSGRPASATAMRVALRRLQSPAAPPAPAALGTTTPAALPAAPTAPLSAPPPVAPTPAVATPRRREPLLLIAGALLALVVLLGITLAVVVGRGEERDQIQEAYAQTVIALASIAAPTAEVEPQPATATPAEPAATPPVAAQSATAGALSAQVNPAAFGPSGPQRPTGARASGEAPAGTDSAGNQITYVAFNTIDGRKDTAWRVAGDGTGQYVQIELAGPVRVSQVQILPGYAKIDPVDGTDRFTQNRRVLRARLEFSDGGAVEVDFADVPDLQAVSLPQPVVTSFVRLVVLATTPLGPDGRDFTPISEIVVVGEAQLQ